MKQNKNILKNSSIAFHIASKRLFYMAKSCFKTLFCNTQVGKVFSGFFDFEKYDKQIATKSDTEKMIIENHNRKIREKRNEKLLSQYGQFLTEEDKFEIAHSSDSFMDTAKRLFDLAEGVDNSKQSKNDFDSDFDFEQ